MPGTFRARGPCAERQRGGRPLTFGLGGGEPLRTLRRVSASVRGIRAVPQPGDNRGRGAVRGRGLPGGGGELGPDEGASSWRWALLISALPAVGSARTSATPGLGVPACPDHLCLHVPRRRPGRHPERRRGRQHPALGPGRHLPL